MNSIDCTRRLQNVKTAFCSGLTSEKERSDAGQRTAARVDKKRRQVAEHAMDTERYPCKALKQDGAKWKVEVDVGGEANGNKLYAGAQSRPEANAEIRFQRVVHGDYIRSGSGAAVHHHLQFAVLFEKRLDSQPEHALAAAFLVTIGVKESDRVGAAQAFRPRSATQGDHGAEENDESYPNDDHAEHPEKEFVLRGNKPKPSPYCQDTLSFGESGRIIGWERTNHFQNNSNCIFAAAALKRRRAKPPAQSRAAADHSGFKYNCEIAH
jgi:hypothetical protein